MIPEPGDYAIALISAKVKIISVHDGTAVVQMWPDHPYTDSQEIHVRGVPLSYISQETDE